MRVKWDDARYSLLELHHRLGAFRRSLLTLAEERQHFCHVLDVQVALILLVLVKVIIAIGEAQTALVELQ